MSEVFVRIIIGNEEKAIWRVDENQSAVINALEDMGAFANDVVIDELNIKLMN